MTRGWGGWAVVVLALGCATASAQQPLDWPRESPPPPLPARQVHFPPYEIRTLSNGLQVVVVMHHEQPAVNLRLMIGAGAASVLCAIADALGGEGHFYRSPVSADMVLAKLEQLDPPHDRLMNHV